MENYKECIWKINVLQNGVDLLTHVEHRWHLFDCRFICLMTFYDCIGYIVPNDGVVIHELGRLFEIYLGYYPIFVFWWTEENHENPSQESLFSGQDLNLIPAEHRLGLLTTTLNLWNHFSLYKWNIGGGKNSICVFVLKIWMYPWP